MHQLDAVNLSAGVASVDAHLDMLRPAIASYGAKVEVRHLEPSAPQALAWDALRKPTLYAPAKSRVLFST